jgi:hypothetical protein
MNEYKYKEYPEGGYYEQLLRPDDTEVCLITEPEDRNFYRDLAPVIDELNQLRTDLASKTEECARLREALKPFANFACDCGECFNCVAQQALKGGNDE